MFAVKVGDLNDFIAPSQACVVNLDGSSKPTPGAEAGEVQLQRRATAAPPGFPQAAAAGGDSALKVSLHDCLACSGCVTSAETVLLQQQSTEELLARLADPCLAVAVSLAPQSVASLAALHGLHPADCAQRLATFLRQLGACAVFDVAAARDVALLEAAQEFLARYRSSARGAEVLAAVGRSQHSGSGSSTAAAAGGSSSGGGSQAMEVDGDTAAAPQPLPLLASACPGWVCYAEKTHGEHVLAYMAATKSPQAVMGTLLKRYWAHSSSGSSTTSGAGMSGEAPPPAAAAAGAAATVVAPGRRLYHCAIMPCYDKKLEAAREDFMLPGTQEAETDCVLATTEVYDLLSQHGVDLKGLPPTPLDTLTPSTSAVPASSSSSGGMAGSSGRDASSSCGGCCSTYQQPSTSSGGSGGGSSYVPPAGGGSGGYLDYVFRTAAGELFGQQLAPGQPLPLKTGRNPDLKELTLQVEGRPALRFAAAYGFRNIQGLMRRLKLGRCEYDYVEIMACPSGCLNGGGQLKLPAGQSPQQLIEQLEQLYHSSSTCSTEGGTAGGAPGGAAGTCGARALPEHSPAVHAVYEQWVEGAPGSKQAQALLHTQYHRREKTVTSTLADW